MVLLWRLMRFFHSGMDSTRLRRLVRQRWFNLAALCETRRSSQRRMSTDLPWYSPGGGTFGTKQCQGRLLVLQHQSWLTHYCFPEGSTAELERQFVGRGGGWRSMNATPFWLHQACSWPRRVG